MHHPKILVVEDDPEDFENLQEAFREVDPVVSVGHIHQGPAVFDYLLDPQTSLPELLIVDNNMPGITGLDILKALSAIQLTRQIPKVLFSTSVSPKDIDESIAYGAIGYKQKPNSFRELVHFAEEMLTLCKPA